MTRWFPRLRSPFVPSDEVRVEAQIDLRDGLLEARADRIRELEQQLACVRAELATYKTKDFMVQALRLRQRRTEEQRQRRSQ